MTNAAVSWAALEEPSWRSLSRSPEPVRATTSVSTRQRALVTGSAGPVKAVREALEGVDFEVSGLVCREHLGEHGEGRGPGSFDCYVQLPVEMTAGQETHVERVGDFLSRGLLARFGAAATVLPTLQPGATVVLVAGDQPDEETLDDPHARFDLLRVLARAVLAEKADLGVRVVVVGARRSPEDIAEIASRRGRVQWPKPTDYARLDGEASYADWKGEALFLSGSQDWQWAVTPMEPPMVTSQVPWRLNGSEPPGRSLQE